MSWINVCWGCGKPEEAGTSKFQMCPKCKDKGLPNSYFCSKDCFTVNWPRHKIYHTQQDQMLKSAEATEKRAVAIATHKDVVDDALDAPKKSCARQIALGSLYMQQNKLNKAMKAFREAVSQSPAEPAGYHNLAVVLSRSNKRPEACTYALMAADKALDGGIMNPHWARSWGVACALLLKPSCAEVPRPAWWTDSELLRLSEAVVGLIPQEAEIDVWQTRSIVLAGAFFGQAFDVPDTRWRSSAQVREAAECLRRQAKLIPYMAGGCLQQASYLDRRAAEVAMLESMGPLSK